MKAFRAQAIKQVITGGNWNPHGTHRARFYGTTVSGFDLGAGVQTTDPFVTAAANFHGMLVDVEPFGAFSSQLFFDSMTFGVDGGYRILAPRSSRITARYINFARNSANTIIAGVASVVWQTSFAKTDGLRVDAFDSPILQAVAAALTPAEVLGLTIRINAYRTIYFDNPNLTNGSPATAAAAKELNAKLTGGGFQPNPARSLLVGTIGLWRKGEPAHEPGERTLVPGGTSPLGSAYARVNGNTLTLDLSNSVPEIDKDLTKQNLGSLTVAMVDPVSKVVTNLGSLNYNQYDRAAYESSAGIVTLALAAGVASAAAQQDIELLDSTNTPLLAELSLRAIPDVPNVYLDEGESVKASFQVYNRGLPAGSALPVTLYQMDSTGGTIVNTTPMTTDAQGVLTVPIAGTAGAISAYVPSLTAIDQPTQGINPLVNTYMYVRTRPADADIARLAPLWANVYAKVLANWNAMAPCMDNWLNLNDPKQVKSFAAILKRLTDPAHFESYRFMPVTRDMSQGQRTLLYKFLDAPAFEAEETEETEAAEAVAAPHSLSFAELSRSMRHS